MNNIYEKDLKQYVYTVGGAEEVMLESDLAYLYGVKTNKIEELVRNNSEMFPKDFYYIAFDNLRKKKVRVFTEEGVMMLSIFLDSEKNVKITMAIYDAFINKRKEKKTLLEGMIQLEKRIEKNEKNIDMLYYLLTKFI